MKKILLIWAGMLCIFLTPAYSQFKEKPIINLQNEDKAFLNWGYYLGFNVFDFKFNYRNDLDDVVVSPSTGFNVAKDLCLSPFARLISSLIDSNTSLNT